LLGRAVAVAHARRSAGGEQGRARQAGADRAAPRRRSATPPSGTRHGALCRATRAAELQRRGFSFASSSGPRCRLTRAGGAPWASWLSTDCGQAVRPEQTAGDIRSACTPSPNR
jgi:hypothetical protein